MQQPTRRRPSIFSDSQSPPSAIYAEQALGTLTVNGSFNQQAGFTYDDLRDDLITQTPFINFALRYDPNHVFLDTSRYQSSLLNNSAYIRAATYKQLSLSVAHTYLPASRSLDQPALWAHGLVSGLRFPETATWHGGQLCPRRTGLSIWLVLHMAWHNIDMKCSVACSGVEDTHSADYKTNSFQLFDELVYAHRATEFLAIEPYANLAYIHLNTDAFREKYRHGAALSLREHTMNTGHKKPNNPTIPEMGYPCTL